MKRFKQRAFSCISVLLAVVFATTEPCLAGGGAGWTVMDAVGAAMAAASSPEAIPAESPRPSSPPTSQAVPTQSATTTPSEAQIFSARVFDEPLVPINGRADVSEDRALANALGAYTSRTESDDCSSLASFASAHPDSRWTGPLLLQLGTEYYNYGYFSKALDAWQRAWDTYRNIQSGPAKPQADRALGELARMYSRLGRVADLSQLLDSTRNRNLEGPATQLIHSAGEALWLMQNKPDYNFGCGPSALDRILLRTDPSKAGNSYLLECKSGTNGFSLPEVADISTHLGMNYQMAFRKPGAPLIIPSVVHWKVDHYAALVEQRDNRILSQDYTFRGSVWMTQRALDEESSGYFLVPPGPLPKGWRAVSAAEGQSIRGKGDTDGENPDGTGNCDSTCGGCNLLSKAKNAVTGLYNYLFGPSSGMTTYTMHALLVSLTLQDTPVQFQSPVGPQVAFTVTYNQLEANQPATFSYSNLGPKWDCSWLTYVTDSPTTPGADVAIYLDGGGTIRFSNFNPTTQTYAPETMTQTLLVRTTPSSYELQYPDGSKREYAQSDGSSGATRRIFLTQMIDPSGNAIQFNYDSQLRITNVVNAIGQAMVLNYTNTAFPFQITSVADPFGRTAYLQYNTNGLLVQVTDVLGLTSQYTYGANQFINALTTPYGTTTFTTGTTNGGSYLTATDPLGATEALETSQSLPVPHALPAGEVPHGLSTFNLFIDARNSFFWDKKAFAEGAWDWSKARIFHWLHQSPNGMVSSRILESIKDPLEGRIWYNYPGEYTNFGAPYYLDAAYSGSSDQPTVVARVLDDGTTAASYYTYNAAGNVTQSIDPAGRTFTYIYATNNIDLLQTRMTRNGKNELISSTTYNAQHLPLTVTDSSGQTITNTYNGRGQLLSVSNPKGETSTFNYDSNGFLTSATGPLGGVNDTVHFTYDGFNRVKTISDTEGYTITLGYDNMDRVASTTFPDGTSQQRVFNRLDVAATADRLGRWTTNTYNALGQLTAVRDPMGHVTQFDWCQCGALTGITDPMGRTTSWLYDLESRAIGKQYPDGSTETITYEDTTSRVHSRRDAAGQETDFAYYPDNTLKSVSYPNASNATPSVAFTYDPDYVRVSTMQDGIGMSVYSYYPIGTPPAPGAGKLQSVSGPLPNSTVSYQYDALGRVLSRAINGFSEAVAYDQLGRVVSTTNTLGLFTYAYVDSTRRLAATGYPNGQTNLFTYYNNNGDQRLQSITDKKPNGSVLSSFGYSYNAVGQVTSWTNQWDTLPSKVWQLNYDGADQLTTAVRTDGQNPLSTNSYAYDAAGNRVLAVSGAMTNQCTYNDLNQIVNGSSGLASGIGYEWDGAHRLTAVTEGNHRSEFSYDGFGHRSRVVEKQSGLVVSDNYFVWCGDELCEERDSTGGSVVRRYFTQGESIIGGTTTNLFYTRDHLGSVREAMDSSATLRTRYDYDPFGQQSILTETAVPSFAFTGDYQHRPSGLYFALNRALDPRAGRWLNRDPLGEAAGINLYAYVGNNPVNITDPSGEVAPVVIVAGGMIVGAAAGLSLAVYLSNNGTFTSPCAQGIAIFAFTVGGALLGGALAVGAVAAAAALAPAAAVAAPVIIYNGPIIERFLGRITNTGG